MGINVFPVVLGGGSVITGYPGCFTPSAAPTSLLPYTPRTPAVYSYPHIFYYPYPSPPVSPTSYYSTPTTPIPQQPTLVRTKTH